MTQARVEEVTGTTVENTHSSDMECTYDRVDDVGFSVDLTIKHGTREEVKSYYDIDVGDPVAVDGLGDEAKWSDGVGLLEVLQGENEFDIQLLDLLTSDGTELDQAKALAADVSAALP